MARALGYSNLDFTNFNEKSGYSSCQRIRYKASLVVYLFSGLVILAQIPVAKGTATLNAMYDFHGLANQPAMVSPTLNTSMQPLYYSPVALYGVGFASHEPTYDAKGVWITHDTYMISVLYTHTITNFNGDGIMTNMFGVWIYYIEGNIGGFFNVDFTAISQSSTYKVGTYNNGNFQGVDLYGNTVSLDFGHIYTGWNYILFGSTTQRLFYSIGNVTDGYENSNPSIPYVGGSYSERLYKNQIGGYDGSDSTVSYIIHSIAHFVGNDGYSDANCYVTLGQVNTVMDTGGDGVIGSTEECDDANTVDGDGCDRYCTAESTYTCSSEPSVGVDLGGDGINTQSSNPDYGDDGNTASSDGCSSTGGIESGYVCGGATSSLPDSCWDLCGDGRIVDLNHGRSYGDDGNTVSGDGCDSTCALETGYICRGGTDASPDVCTDRGGDGVLATSRNPSNYGDDGNNIDGDGGSSNCVTETNYDGTGATTTTADVGTYHEVTVQTTTATQVAASTVAASMVTNSCVSLINMSSAQSIFASMNQIQLLMLLSLFGVELPFKLYKYLESLNVMLLSFDVSSIPYLEFLSFVLNQFDYPQKNPNLDLLGVSSGSTFINILGAVGMLFIMMIINLIVGLCYYKYRKNPTKNCFSRFLKKLNSSFLFGVYIRLMIESCLILILSSFSEVHHADITSGNKLRSIVFAALILFLLGCMMVLVCINWGKVKQKDHFNGEVKENIASRSFTFMSLGRLFLFSIILLTITKYYDNLKVVLISFLQVGHGVYIIVVRPFKSVQNNINEVINECGYTFFVCIFLYCNNQQRWTGVITDIYLNGITANIMVLSGVSVIFLGVLIAKKCLNRKKTTPKQSKATNNPSETSNFEVQSNSIIALTPQTNQRLAKMDPLDPHSHYNKRVYHL